MLASALVLWLGWVMLHKHELVLAWPTKYREAKHDELHHLRLAKYDVGRMGKPGW
jgi:hypothetical protein